MLNGRTVSVVVPAFEEERLLGGVLKTMPSWVDLIVVVDDASFDRTSEVAKESGDRRVEVLRHATRRGVGAAIVTGYLHSVHHTHNETDAVAVMAGDGQMSPDELESVVLPIVRGEADYVKGTRFGAANVRRTMGTGRWLGGQVFSRLTSLAVGQAITDSQCGFSAISQKALRNLDIENLWPSYGYPNDLLGMLAQHSFRINEVPVTPIYGEEVSKLRLRHLPPIFFLIARAAWRRHACSIQQHHSASRA